MKRTLLAVLVALAGCGSPNTAPPADGTAIPATSTSPEAVQHLRAGEELFDNLRTAEASAEFAKALELDPNFTLARLYHGFATPGPDGLKEVEAAAAAADNLPEAERLMIEGAAATRRGDVAAANAAYTKLTEVAPGAWRAHFLRGQQLLQARQAADAVTSLRQATTLNPEAGAAQNSLGYAALQQGDTNSAIAAFEQYARILPNEPNPQDSLGEALLSAGRFAEAEAAFQKALTLSPQFWTAHEGIAYARLYAGNVQGGRDALNAARAGATRLVDQLGVDDELAAVALSQRDTAGALAILDGIEKAEGADASAVAFVPVRRALVMNDAGRHPEALAAAAAALAIADGGNLPAGQARGLRRQALFARATTEAAMGDVAALTQTSAALDEGAAANPELPFAQSAMHYGQGLLALAKGDAAGARAHFAQCSDADELCKWQDVMAAEKAGDTAGAAIARDKMLELYLRDPLHLVVRSRLTAPTS